MMLFVDPLESRARPSGSEPSPWCGRRPCPRREYFLPLLKPDESISIGQPMLTVSEGRS
jgi:hypothetical protein